MHSDSFYTKGNSHKENQDYAMHGTYKEQPFAIVADGCSSVPRTDFGARLLAQAASFCLPDIDNTIHTAAYYAQSMHLPLDILCSTLLMVRFDNNFKVNVFGDGFVIYKNDNIIKIIEITYKENAPCYLRYKLDETLANEYWAKVGPVYYRTTYVFRDFELVSLQDDEVESKNPPFDISLNFNADWVGVSTDGLSSFSTTIKSDTGIQLSSISVADMIDLFNFKGMNGEFVNRRCRRAFKDYAVKNWQNTDDFALGMVSK